MFTRSCSNVKIPHLAPERICVDLGLEIATCAAFATRREETGRKEPGPERDWVRRRCDMFGTILRLGAQRVAAGDEKRPPLLARGGGGGTPANSPRAPTGARLASARHSPP